MNRTLISTISAAIIMIAAVSCNGVKAPVDESLTAAELCLADGDLESAMKEADGVYANDTARMSASELARLSIVYMELSDRADDPSPVLRAVKCYRKAIAMAPDSATTYYSSLPVDREHYYFMLNEIVRHIDMPHDSIPEFDEPLDAPEEADSLWTGKTL